MCRCGTLCPPAYVVAVGLVAVEDVPGLRQHAEQRQIFGLGGPKQGNGVAAGAQPRVGMASVLPVRSAGAGQRVVTTLVRV